MQKLSFKVNQLPNQDGQRLDHLIAESEIAKQHSFSRGFIRKLIVAGAVYAEGRRVRIASKIIKPGVRIDLYWDEKKSAPAPFSKEVNNYLPLKVLYEDNAVVCFEKPAGLPTQPTIDEARLNLYALAKKQRGTYLGLHHRLDRDTSGVVLFTCVKEANGFVADQFAKHIAKKTYVAVVEGKLDRPSGRVESFLDVVAKYQKKQKFGSVRSGGKKAITNFSVLESSAHYSLVEVTIETGRTHQIRVHLSEMGHPIVGDTFYGAKAQQGLNRHLLHAHALAIMHPESGNWIRVESPVPEEFRKWVLNKQ